MANLYSINELLFNAIEYGVDENGEILEGQELDNKINEISMALDDKMENIACYVKNLQSDVDALKAEAKTLTQRAKTKENQIEYLKRYLSNFMQMNEIPKFETPKCKVSFRKSSSVEITDIAKVPKKFKTIVKETKVDKTELKKYLATLKDNKCAGAYILEKSNIGIK